MTLTRTWHGCPGRENAERPIPPGRVMRRSVIVIDEEEASGAWSCMFDLGSEILNRVAQGMIEWSEQ